MAHFYVNTIVFLTVQQTIAVPRQRKTQCEQWNNEGFFFFLLCCCLEEKKKKNPPDPYKTNTIKKNLAWYNCFLRLWFGYVKCYFFRGGDRMWTQSVCVCLLHARTWGSRTRENTQVHVYMASISRRRLLSCVLVCMLTGISDGC